MKRTYRNLGSKRLRLRYRESADRLDAMQYVKGKLEEAGYEFDKLTIGYDDLPAHDMLHFTHPRMGHIQIPARYVPKELQDKRAIGKALSASIEKAESAYRKLHRKKHLAYSDVCSSVDSKNESAHKIGSLILLRALKHNGVEIN